MARGPETIITSEDILGKEAIDPEGEFLGIVIKLHIDREKKSLLGLTVDQGFMKPDLFVGLDFIDRFGVDAVFLNRIPFEKYRGLKVYTHEGVLLGVVEEALESQGRLERIVLRLQKSESLPSIRKRSVEIAARHVAEIGSSVLLKKGVLPESGFDTDSDLRGNVTFG